MKILYYISIAKMYNIIIMRLLEKNCETLSQLLRLVCDIIVYIFFKIFLQCVQNNNYGVIC